MDFIFRGRVALFNRYKGQTTMKEERCKDQVALDTYLLKEMEDLDHEKLFDEEHSFFRLATSYHKIVTQDQVEAKLIVVQRMIIFSERSSQVVCTIA
ncbi:hypothetical protein ABG067_006770 [Albugo candida]